VTVSCRHCRGRNVTVTSTSGQDVVRCIDCDRFSHNAPRTETGRRQRSLSTREGITPSQRARILAVHSNACIYCGKRPPEVRLELEHMIPRELAEQHGLLDDLIDSIHNLAPACPECNSGRRHAQFNANTVALMLRALHLAAQVAENE
jgi:5-methylcytosine-specific restriction endonuclease McrA